MAQVKAVPTRRGALSYPDGISPLQGAPPPALQLPSSTLVDHLGQSTLGYGAAYS